jgi:hypothetical protein
VRKALVEVSCLRRHLTKGSNIGVGSGRDESRSAGTSRRWTAFAVCALRVHYSALSIEAMALKGRSGAADSDFYVRVPPPEAKGLLETSSVPQRTLNQADLRGASDRRGGISVDLGSKAPNCRLDFSNSGHEIRRSREMLVRSLGERSQTAL